jgi:ribosomal protein L11 methylase PrmA
MQTDNTLILRDSKFKALKHEELVKANITIKPIKQLLPDILLIFNKYILRQEGDLILLVQKG